MIEVVNLRKTYSKKAALHGISFAAKDGKVTGLVGPNGAGKTTALKIIAGLDTMFGIFRW